MTQKLEPLVDTIFTKLKNYKNKKIYLEREDLKIYLSSLFKGI